MGKKVKPVRIQLSRKRGFNLQEYSKSINGLECVNVARPSKYGNPFKIVGDMIYGDAGHRRKILSKWIYIEPDQNNFVDWSKPMNEIAVSLHINWLCGNDKNYIIPVPFKNVKELKGKNLACWCPTVNCSCHADTLLLLSNK